MTRLDRLATTGVVAQRCALCLVAWLSLAPLQARAATPLDDLIEPAAGKSACFIRVYGADHLRRNPRQKTRSMTVWLKYQPAGPGVPGVALGLGLEISLRGDRLPFFAQGGCEWDPHANRDTGGKRLLPTFKKEAGANCLMSAQPDVFESVSAEEGGFLVLDRGRDNDTVMVYLDESLIMVKRANRAKHLDVWFGVDDRVFRLHRTDSKDCAAVENAVTEREPTSPPRPPARR